MIVYELWHEYEVSPDVDSARLIGIYSTRENAERALAHVRKKPGFRDYPDQFQINDDVVDRDGWTEGFGPA